MHKNITAALADQTRDSSIHGSKTKCWGKTAETEEAYRRRHFKELVAWRLAEQAVLSLSRAACIGTFFHKYVYSLLRTSADHVLTFVLFCNSSARCFIACSLVLL